MKGLPRTPEKNAKRGSGAGTRDRILDTAERLFAEHGMAEVSLRTIMAQAGVNIAAVHYHFGGRHDLIEAVFARQAIDAVGRRLARLEECAEAPGRPPLVEQILIAFLVPGIGGDDERSRLVARFRARLYAESNDFVRYIQAKYFDSSTLRFIDALAKELSHLPLEELHWRFHFLLGAMFYINVNASRMQSLTSNAWNLSDSDTVLFYMVPAMAAMLRAPANDGRSRGDTAYSTVASDMLWRS